jgi:predicted ATPase/DNA-binding XRE family transcriptional regulator
MERTEAGGAVDLGTLLRRYREARRLSQEELAERARPVLSVDTISKIERGRSRPYRHTLEALCTALDLTPAERAAVAAARRGAGGAGAATRSMARDEVPAPAEAGLERSPGARALAVPLTPLVGREREEAAIADLLQQEGLRLLTLTGPGGVGKTRLALHVAAALRGDFADGAAVVSLAALRDPALVLPAIAHALGAPAGGARTPEERLIAYLGGRHLLLVLDNFEQVAAAGPALAALLGACARVTALVTSRAALHVRGEHEFLVPPLALPGPAHAADPAALRRIASVVLLMERARAVRPGLALTAENAAAVAAVCTRLDGLPLALELAAVRLKLLSPKALLARLEHRLTVLVGGARDLPARQQTLRDTLAWSHGLLTADEQMLFRRLGVFAGGCTLEAAEAVYAGTGGEARDLSIGIASLHEQNLLYIADQPDGDPRIAMLETVREFALEELERSEEATGVRWAHARYYLALAEDADTDLHGQTPAGPKSRKPVAVPPHAAYPRAAAPATEESRERRSATWLRRLDAEHDNVRASLRWLLDAGDPASAMRLAAALWWFWAARGYYREGRQWLEAVLQMKCGRVPDVLRANVLLRAACLASMQGEYAHANQLFEETASLYHALGDDTQVAALRTYIGRNARLQGDHERAERLVEDSLARFRQVDDTPHIALALLSLGDIAYDRGALPRSATFFAEARSLFASLGNAEDVAWATKCLGDVAAAQGDTEVALLLLEEGLARFRAIPHAMGVAETLLTLARVAHLRDDIAQAAALYRQSLRLHADHGNRFEIAQCLDGLAGVAAQAGAAAQAARLLGAAAELRAASLSLSPIHRAAYDRTVAAVHASLGEREFAAAWAAGSRLPLEQVIARALELEGSQRPGAPACEVRESQIRQQAHPYRGA